MLKKNSISQNLLFAFGAQGLSMLLSILMAMFLPKVLGVHDYSFWQLFIFYTSYAGFFHLGLNDGIYLRLGGEQYKNLNYKLLHADLILSTIMQIIVCAAILVVAGVSTTISSDRMFVLICTAICIVFTNYTGYFSYILQLSNRIKEYSIGVVINKASYLVVVLIGIYASIGKFPFYIIFYLITQLIAIVYVLFVCKELIKARPVSINTAFKDIIDNIKIGINLTISNVASMLILGVGRSLIDYQWGVDAFGKFSLALSLSNFFLQFISQVSLVLFPAFRRLSDTKIKEYHVKLRTLLSTTLAGILLGYMPLYYLLSYWLPQYSESMRYMVILLPICTFDGKMDMLCSTYLKILRKEKILLRINLISLSVSVLLCSVSALIIKDIYAVTISMVICIAFRSILAESILSSFFEEHIFKDIALEVCLSIIFVTATWFIGPIQGFCIYIVAYIIFLILKKNQLLELKSMIRP